MIKNINIKNKKESLNFNDLDRDFQKLLKDFKNSDKIKSIIITKTREIVKNSKQAIYSIHREEISEAKRAINNIEIELSRLRKKFKQSELESINMYKAALQEYVEARTFLDFILTGKISSSSKLKVNYHDYLCGLADLTGELGRYCVMSATKNRHEKVKEIKNFIDYLLGQFLKFDFNNGELRKKYDAIKWNLSKIEGILYDHTLKKSK